MAPHRKISALSGNTGAPAAESTSMADAPNRGANGDHAQTVVISEAPAGSLVLLPGELMAVSEDLVSPSETAPDHNPPA